MNYMAKGASAVLVIVLAVSLAVESLPDSRTDPKVATGRQGRQKGSNESCHSIEEIARRVEVCAKPMTDILQGSVEKWPKNEIDVQDLCNSFIPAERCIREVGRKCTKGLHKTIISTLANSISRTRKRECLSSKFPSILQTTMCIEKHQGTVHSLMANIISRLKVIDTKINDLDQKTTAVCCMVHEIERDIKTIFGPKCPAEANLVVRLYRGVLEDVIEIICRQPKCVDIFKGQKVPKGTDYTGIISVLLRIVFSLG